MKERHIEVRLSFPYYTLNKLTPSTNRIWIIFHGYGMLSRFFIRKFSDLDPEENYIIAPQGLSKFYQDGFSGRVGATWMTKEDRLTEIENQRRYLVEIVTEELEGVSEREIICLGFSQGAATASRFLAHSKLPFNKLVLWAGTFPPEITPEMTTHWSDSSEIIYVTGLYDPFLQPGMIDHQHKIVKDATGKDLRRIEFEGKHELRSEVLHKL